MVSITRSEFDALNAKVDQILEFVNAIAETYVEESAGFSRNFQEVRKEIEASREETRQRFDQLDGKVEGLAIEVDSLKGKVDGLTQAHDELRHAFDRHDEHSR